jgi:hypothetical protein
MDGSPRPAPEADERNPHAVALGCMGQHGGERAVGREPRTSD